MAVEKMSCCGALTHTYRDAGHRTHAADCPAKHEPIAHGDEILTDAERMEIFDAVLNDQGPCASTELVVERILRAKMAQAWETGFLACQDEKHQQYDNPYKEA